MENIRQPITRILFNSIANTKIGVYGDGKMGRLILNFKELGINLPGDSYTAGTSALSASGTKNTNLTLAKSQTDDGVKKAWLIEFNPMQPDVLTHWGYGLTLRPKTKMPGVHDNRHRAHQKSYSGTLNAVTCTNGYVDDTFVLAAEDDIIEQIALDTGMHNINQRPEENMSEAPCYAYRTYKITIDGAAAADIDITIDGTTTSVTLGTTSILSANAINANATVQASVRAWAISTTEIMVASRTNGLLFTVADGGGAGTLVVDNRYIMLMAKSEKVKFDVDMNQFAEMNATLIAFSLYEIGSTTTAGKTYMSIDGTADATGADDHDPDTAATYAANLNARAVATGFAATNVYFSHDAYVDRTIMYVTSTYKNVKLTFSATSTSVLNASYSYFAKYPSLTWEDVHREFANQKGAGKLSAFINLDQPDPTADYIRYYMKFDGDKVSALHGQSYNTTHSREVILYVKKGIEDDNIYDANNPNTQYNLIDEAHAAAGNDTSLEGILQVWSGIAPSAW